MSPDEVRAILGRVAAAYPGTRCDLTHDAHGWVIWFGAFTFVSETPRAAAFRAVTELARWRAETCHRIPNVSGARERAERFCDALSEAYAALGGDWSKA